MRIHSHCADTNSRRFRRIRVHTGKSSAYLKKLFYAHSLTRAALSSEGKVLDAYMLADSIKGFWWRVSSLHKTVAINSDDYRIMPNGLREWRYTPAISILYTPEKGVYLIVRD